MSLFAVFTNNEVAKKNGIDTGREVDRQKEPYNWVPFG
jgi:hypothetical protein